MNTFNYNITDGFLWSEVNLKGERKYYVEGYASTIDQDKAGEIISSEAQADIYTQILNENITMDLEHEQWYDENDKLLPRPRNDKIPIAKIVAAELRPKGVWVKAEINRNIPSFQSVWGSIKEGFLKAFSVAFYPVAKAGNVIKRLNLVNVTLTGSPVNPNATFAVAMKSAKAYLDSLEQNGESMEDVDLKGETEFNGKQGKWRTVRGKKIFFSDDGKAYGGDGKEFKEFDDDMEPPDKEAMKKQEAKFNKWYDEAATFGLNNKESLAYISKRVTGSKPMEARRHAIDSSLKANPPGGVDLNPSGSKESSETTQSDKVEQPTIKNDEENKMADEEYKCKDCDKEFPSKEALDKHYEEAHKKKEPEEKAEKEEKEDSAEDKKEDKAEDKKEEPEVKSEAQVKAEKEADQILDLIAQVKALKEENIKLKADLEKPVMKAKMYEVPKIPVTEQKYITPLNLLGR